eukprot:g83216.t1
MRLRATDSILASSFQTTVRHPSFQLHFSILIRRLRLNLLQIRVNHGRVEYNYGNMIQLQLELLHYYVIVIYATRTGCTVLLPDLLHGPTPSCTVAKILATPIC